MWLKTGSLENRHKIVKTNDSKLKYLSFKHKNTLNSTPNKNILNFSLFSINSFVKSTEYL